MEDRLFGTVRDLRDLGAKAACTELLDDNAMDFS